jgi:hypothetical protein
MTRHAKFKQSDIARILKAAEQSGVKVAIRIEPDGTIMVLPAPETAPPEPKRRGPEIVL